MAKVLMFHRILPVELIKEPNAYSVFGTLVSQDHFDQVVKLFANRGNDFVTISELTKLTSEKSTDNLVAITFDDGYRDNYEYALPILDKYNVRATFFPVVTPCIQDSVLPLDIYYQCIDESNLPHTEREDAIKGDRKRAFYWMHPDEQIEFLHENFKFLPDNNTLRVRYMNQEQIKTLSHYGHEIGSHGMTHSLFTAEYMTNESKQHELLESKLVLERITGSAVTAFCFPAGRYQESDLELVRQNGYTSACLVKKEFDHLFPTYERIFVHGNSLEQLKSLV